MEIINIINLVVAIFVFICCAHQFVYLLIPFLKRHKPHKKTVLHRYAVLISARNEEAVIGDLLRTINNQTYPSHLVQVFVVADNCTDATADRAKAQGAVVWERFNREKVGKGYALNFLLKQIKEAYPEDPFDGYFVFDADNLLDENYIAEMNKTFSDGHEIITSYRNSKNFGDNWITAGYGLMFLREAKFLNNSRMLLNTSCAVSGTGFLFSRAIKNKMRGWHFHLLTEDIQFTAHNVMHRRKIAYCPSAVLYDEQPTSFQQSWTQRERWAKGYLQVFTHYCIGLSKGILKYRSFSCYDMLMSFLPTFILTVGTLVMNVIAIIVGACTGADVSSTVGSVVGFLVNAYVLQFIMGAMTAITEWKNIHCRNYKKVLAMFTYPVFMFLCIPINVAALLHRKVEWKPIRHGGTSATVSEIRAQGTGAEKKQKVSAGTGMSEQKKKVS